MSISLHAAGKGLSTGESRFAKSKPGGKHQGGFTLLEVLVAGFILFLVISTMTMIYRGALLSSNKAERALVITQALPFILDEIRVDIRDIEANDVAPKVGEGRVFRAEYNWTAEMLEYTAPPSRFDVDQTRFVDYSARFKLWQVSLTVNTNHTERTFTYRELSW